MEYLIFKILMHLNGLVQLVFYLIQAHKGKVDVRIYQNKQLRAGRESHENLWTTHSK
jgi:hypothetical protein